MATFTNATKTATTFANQSKSSATFANQSKTLTDYLLLIDATYKLLIGDGYFLKIESASGSIVWANQTKQ